MSRRSTTRPALRGLVVRSVRRVIGSLLLAAALAGSPVVAASAAPAAPALPGSRMSLGSIPAEVAAYVADGSMVARLADVYGRNAAGAGVEFDDTTKAGAVTRVYEWTAQRLTNAPTDHPVQLTNNWIVPVTIGGDPVGIATIWINPQSVAPELATFDKSAALATALAAVPAQSALVRDPVTGAWLALENGTVTPLVAGTSGITKPVSVDSLRLSASPAPALSRGEPNIGLGLAIGGVGLVIVVLVVALLVPRRRRRGGAVATVEPTDVAEAAETVGRAEVARPVTDVADEPTPPVGPASRARTIARRTATPVTKPALPKPGAASAKPPAQKPPAQKPPVQKPPVQKPPAQKPPTRKPPTRKPPAPDEPAD